MLTYHVVQIFAVRLLQSTDGERDLVDPLLPPAFETKDSVAEVHSFSLASAPELRLRRIHLCINGMQKNETACNVTQQYAM